jgi:hypothetical protein
MDRLSRKNMRWKGWAKNWSCAFSSIGSVSRGPELRSIPEYIPLSKWRAQHSRRRTSAVQRASVVLRGHAIAVLTCQNRAAAPRKPGDFVRSAPMRLCDAFAWAGMVGRYWSEKCIVCVLKLGRLSFSEVWHELRNDERHQGLSASRPSPSITDCRHGPGDL